MVTAGTKVIRVFLSSTFVDFQEERSLLVKQVFPSLRRRAKSRGVDIVDVDLRWGVTVEQTERGETLPLCLAEIDNCRPYFISLLGERYGWVPPADFYQPALLERQPWLRERMGGASVTELEILHGVLRNPEMAGHALFYLRDPAYAQAQQEAGWVAENHAEQQRLQALKQQVRASGFPVVEEGLATPQAIAERIEADLWAVIEREHPEQEPPDALQREGQRHSDYRRSRTGLYLGGEAAIEQLERWIAEGEQQILITGESGAGKSALIANWLEAHQRSYPQDVVHAHHLGCTNDASALRPLLGRLIDTASQLLVEEQQISKPIEVPQDWWELVFKVGEVFALLSPWCEHNGRRWILVLDGLDRLAEDDQQALPWIPTTIPPGIHVVASALDCQARTILQERQYRTHEIGPLGKAEQQQLIERYLSRYTKQLESGLKQKILKHPLAGSPLFLRVLLEELRQCAWYDTLAEQLDFYLSAMTIDGLYCKVLERLERDGHGEATCKALTALWASRAGLSEAELLEIRGLAPLEWVPVDLALSEALGRNGERIVFDHDYLESAVLIRYLPNKQAQRDAHSSLADRIEETHSIQSSNLAEHEWQLLRAGRLDDLRTKLLNPRNLSSLIRHVGCSAVAIWWQESRNNSGENLAELIGRGVYSLTENMKDKPEELMVTADSISDLLKYLCLDGELSIYLRSLSLMIAETQLYMNTLLKQDKKSSLALTYCNTGQHEKAVSLFREVLEERKQTNKTLGQDTLAAAHDLGSALMHSQSFAEAKIILEDTKSASARLLGPTHPITLSILHSIGLLYSKLEIYSLAEDLLVQAFAGQSQILGYRKADTLKLIHHIGIFYYETERWKDAGNYLEGYLDLYIRVFGSEHPETLLHMTYLGCYYIDTGEYEKSRQVFDLILEVYNKQLGRFHSDTLFISSQIARCYEYMHQPEKSELLLKTIWEDQVANLGFDNPDHIQTESQIMMLYVNEDGFHKAESFLLDMLRKKCTALGTSHNSTIETLRNLGYIYKLFAYHEQSIEFYSKALAGEESGGPLRNDDSFKTACYLAELFYKSGNHDEAARLMQRITDYEESIHYHKIKDYSLMDSLGALHKALGDPEKAESYYLRSFKAKENILSGDHSSSLSSLKALAKVYESSGDYEKAEKAFKTLLASCERKLGSFNSETLLAVEYLGWLYRLMDRYEESEQFYSRLLHAKEQESVVQHADILNCLTSLGWLYKKMSKYQMAELFYERALETSRYVYELPSHDILQIVTELGEISLILEDYENSEMRYSYVLEQMNLLEGQDETSLLSNLGSLAEKLRLSGHIEKSVDLLSRKLKLVRRSVSSCSGETLLCIGEFACLLCDVDRKDEAESLCNELTTLFAKCIDSSSDSEYSFDMLSAEIQYSILLYRLGKPDRAYHRVNQLISRLNGYTFHESVSATRQCLLLALDLREAIENRLKQEG